MIVAISFFILLPPNKKDTPSAGSAQNKTRTKLYVRVKLLHEDLPAQMR